MVISSLKEEIISVFQGPGLAIRVLCMKEPFIDDNFSSTNTLLAALSTFYGSNLVVSV